MPRAKSDKKLQPKLIEVEPSKETKFEREADKIINAEMKRRKANYQWANEGEAFAHLFTQYKFDFGEDEAAQACQVGRAGHDKGIDAYHLEDGASDSGVLYIIQTKSNRITHDENVLYDDVRRSVDFLEKGKIEGAKNTLGEVVETYKDAVRMKFDVIFSVGLNGNADKVRAALPEFEASLPSHCQVEIFDMDDIRALVMRPKHIASGGPTVTFHNLPVKPWELELPERKLPKIFTCAIYANELGSFVRQNRLSIFRLNVREYLGQKNPVNKIVGASLREHPERFHYLNLGIDAVCDPIKVQEIPELDNQSTWTLKVPNFQIVNGCQTAKTISDIDVNPKALVMLRLFQVERDERDRLVPEISVAKNRQSPIHGRDLFAWDKSQTRLKKEFERIGYFFETREKEWSEFSKHSASARKLYPNERIDNTAAARAYLSVFLQDPFRAKHRKKDFFQHEKEGGVFEKIFSETSAEQMLLAYYIYDFVSGKCKQAGAAFRKLAKEAEERTLNQEDEYKLEENNVIWNGDTFLAALIGFFINLYFEQSLAEDKTLTLTQHLLPQVSQKNHKTLNQLFDFARETIIQAYMFGKRGIKTQRLYTPRRFYYQDDTYDILTEQARAKNLHTLSDALKPLRK